MSDINTSADQAATDEANLAIDQSQNGATSELNPQGESVAAKKVLTVEEKLKAIDTSIERLQARRAHLVEFGTAPHINQLTVTNERTREACMTYLQ